jgi:DNA-binding Lrp family transcriptional regulator
MRTSAPPLLPIFRSRLQGDLLARVLLDPNRLTVSELARELAAPVPTVQREVSRLEEAGVLVTTRLGRARLVAPNNANPALGPLRDLVMIAFGPRQVVGEEFADLGATAVLIFGSWAARYADEPGPPSGDVDVLVVGRLDRDEVFDAAQRAETRLGREVNTTIVSDDRWAAAAEPFLREIKHRPLVPVLTT